MKAVDIFETLCRSGAELTLDGEKLRVNAPKGTLTPDMLNQMDRFKPELIDLLKSEIKWRVEAMRAQITAGKPVPFLIARKNSEKEGECLSCGDVLSSRNHVRCWFCEQASRKVISELR